MFSKLDIFLLEQGYKAAETITVLQNNQSAILLEQKDILSSSKKTKHLNVRYFFVKQNIDKNEVVIFCCPTDIWVGDFFSKPLRSTKFIEFRCKIMNVTKHVSLLKVAQSRCLVIARSTLGTDSKNIRTDTIALHFRNNLPTCHRKSITNAPELTSQNSDGD